MKTIFTIAWRNIWRHPGRSGVLIAAITAGLWAGVVTVGTMNGLLLQRVNYLIESEITHLQMHHPEFLTERRPADSLSNTAALFRFLDSDARVSGWAPRVLSDAMLQSPVKTSGVRIRGLDPEREMRTTTFLERLTDGDYLSIEGVRNPLLMGEALMEQHRMRLGDRIVLTFETTGGELTSAAFNIVGQFRSASTEYDESTVLVHADDLSQHLSPVPVYHEVGILLHDIDDAPAVASALNEGFPEIRAQTWTQVSPELSTLVAFSGFMLYVVTIIIMTALAFGILNTMLMALFERLREIAMLLSIGMSRARIFVMILLEAVLLTLTGAAAGFALAGLSLWHFSGSGINFEMFAEGTAELGWDHLVFPVITTGEFISIGLIVVFVTLAASLYPAFKAIKIQPIQ
ncbi:ABC-type transport system, involved in lipoprotein release, permease component [Cyclonatronum proteinivorum]|uniref:ABC-type transport system, involved in lipoprotein release, permease component n=1 Tax=Cyclonatronum proteinivorum TaxID=1457365 RepID=A0A345UG24_9BACT|nr:FtsX-like permease family protein [Cyclonatronum proteinivorum]AXI99425.1 ABC-type transport system, involved in lipoprotein release, permease component [Cyclonatronum proteinivorum]